MGRSGVYVSKEFENSFNEGNNIHAYEKLGVHFMSENGIKGASFCVWAPKVKSVCVTGRFNGWDENGFYLEQINPSGFWYGFIPEVKEDDEYKYIIETYSGERFYKADPYAFYAQKRPETASRARDISYKWHDDAWMKKRKSLNHFKTPKNIYEVHAGSWKRHPEEERPADDEDGFYTYSELAKELVAYVKDMGYTHIELLPLMEHPFDGSWGYQTTGFYAATSRYGTPQELMHFIDCCHKEGIGVILDWVPGHFCKDAHGLSSFNGEYLYEKEEHPHWGTFKFNYESGPVRSFLLSNVVFWLEKYHVDGIRVDGVSSMLYLNYGIDDKSKMRYNKDGGEGDLAAISFLQELSRIVGSEYPGVMMIAEESSAWPLVTCPPDDGGLGFHYKWDMGWMNDTLNYMKADFPYRSGCHNMLTFSMMYAFNENFILPLSHDEVVHGKCSLVGRMPGDYWRQFAGLRLLAFYQITHSGGKLNFMGNEIGQFIEWRYYEGIEWFLLDYEAHQKHQNYIKALNHFYKSHKALWDCEHDWNGFKWLDADNNKQCVLSYERMTIKKGSILTVVMNCDVQAYETYRIGVPSAGTYEEVFNSDAEEFGGSGVINTKPVKAEKIPFHGEPYSIEVRLPALGGIIYRKSK